MSDLSLKRFARVYFAPPKYLALPTTGIDISTSSIKSVRLVERMHGLEVADFDEMPLPEGAIENGEILKIEPVIETLKDLAKKRGIRAAHVSLPESKSYLFESKVSGHTETEWRAGIERHIDELVPLPPANVMFDIAALRKVGNETRVVGVGYAARLIEQVLSVLDDAHIEPYSLESETFAATRALLPPRTDETVLVVDIGKTTTKLVIAERRLPRFATTLEVGGDALTRAVEKYFGVGEEQARRVKIEHGIVSSAGNDEYLSAMLSTVSVIREEIKRRLDYWQTHSCLDNNCTPVSRVVLVGGNATVRGLPEYLAGTLKVPVALGDVFTNLASRDAWLPSVDHAQSFAYTTAIGLALRDYDC
ncbi:MAG: hypothetical protein B7X04_03735 [Parcubacteria group bacterium 21-54-25]|nr:MAG: hypothetical protein B7X04_03735 [Parcubacteria group bacterium 21-54-25]HQU08272.1 pilus assembly protein PilM [Candidatus Paceibacterota bacterium]